MNIYKKLLENLNLGIETLITTRYNLSNREINKEIHDIRTLDGELLNYFNKVKETSKININIDRDENILFEIFKRESRLIIFGAGHVGYNLANFASKVGFKVTILDDRPYFANKDRFEADINVICDSFVNSFDKLKINKEDYVVIVTRGHKHDKFCLKRLLEIDDISYMGMIGSKRRVKLMKEELVSEGYSREILDKLYSPIGMNIGAVTPEEISISILAELISIKRIGKLAVKNEPIKVNDSSELDRELIDVLASEKNENMSLVTVIATKGSTPRKAGSKMLVYETGKVIGTIGGGCAEAKIITDAAIISRQSGFEIKTIDMTGEYAEEDGMVCGGIMTVLIESI